MKSIPRQLRRLDTGNAESELRALIRASSFGSPEARADYERAPQQLRQAIRDRVLRTLRYEAPVHRTILAVDIEQSTTRTNRAKARLREVLYDLLEGALCRSGIPAEHRDPLLDRGDGVLALVRPADQVPKTLLLNSFFPALSRLLATHNGDRPLHRFRLRAAMHCGEVLYDPHGPFGEAVDLTCRLLDAPQLKSALAHTTEPLVLAVSNDLYWSVVRHQYGGIDRADYQPKVEVELAGQRHQGFVAVPG